MSLAKEAPRIAFGIGTRWYKQTDRQVVDAIKDALKVGFRHLDAAEEYGNEEQLGEAIAEFLAENPEVKRSDLFITTKVFSTIADIPKAIKTSLSKLKLNYVDLYLIHAPFFSLKGYNGTIPEAWEHMQKLHDDGLARFIGVSNFGVEHLKQLENARIKPAFNQIEYHPYLQQPELLEYNHKAGIITSCFGPLASIVYSPNGPVDAVVNNIAAKHGKTAAQILLQWSLSKGNYVITTSSKPARLAEYLDALSLSLSADEIAQIDAAGSQLHFRQFWKSSF